MSNNAPFSLAGLLVSDDSSEEVTDDSLYQYETQELTFGDLKLNIVQSAFHPTNANKVWPGAYILSEYLLANWERLFPCHSAVTLELGAATGALSIFLKLRGLEVVTSDYDDGGEIEKCIKLNMAQNGVSSMLHVPHTWGTSWFECYSNAVKSSQGANMTDESNQLSMLNCQSFKCNLIIASDILLYVSAYSALVNTLLTLFRDCGAQEFTMSWNRRIADSESFFRLMREAGFTHEHHGRGVHSFYLRASNSASNSASINDALQTGH